MRAVKSYDIARKIYEIEHADFKTQKEWRLDGKKEWVIAEPLLNGEYSREVYSRNGFIDSISMEKSPDHLCWYLWAHMTGRDSPHLKIVPAMDLEVKAIQTILESQPWVFV